MHLIRVPRRPDKAPAIGSPSGCETLPESWRDYFYWTSSSTTRARSPRERAPASQPCARRGARGPATSACREVRRGEAPRKRDVGRVTSVCPLWGIEGGRVTLEGDGSRSEPDQRRGCDARRARAGAGPPASAPGRARRARIGNPSPFQRDGVPLDPHSGQTDVTRPRLFSGGLRPAGLPERAVAGAPCPAPRAWLARWRSFTLAI